MHAAYAMMAKHDEWAVVRQGVAALRDLIHRDVEGIFDPANFQFGVFSHVEKEDVFVVVAQISGFGGTDFLVHC